MTKPKQQAAPKLLEQQFVDRIIGLAMLQGWRVAHFRPALTSKGWRTPVQGDGKGFPDLIMVRAKVQIVAECKSEGEEPTDDQRAWLQAFAAIPGCTCFVWWPHDWDEIEPLLKRA